MRSRKVDFRIPHRWYEWIERRALQMKPRPYKSVAAYFMGLSFHDAMVQRPHTLTIDFANASIDEQDRVIEELIMVSPSQPISGSWLEHRLSDAISEVAKRHGVTITQEEIMEMLVRKIREYVLNPDDHSAQSPSSPGRPVNRPPGLLNVGKGPRPQKLKKNTK